VKKCGQLPIVYDKKTNSSYSKQMEQDLSTHHCQAKCAKSHDATSSGSIRDENPCKRAETANSPTQPASTEETHQEKAQDTHPWMEEVRSKGTKRSSIFLYFCPKDVHGTIRGRRSIATLLFLCTFLMWRYLKNQKTKFLEY